MLVNVTPHEINFYRESDTVGVGFKRVLRGPVSPFLTVPPSGVVARAVEIRNPAGDVDGIPLTTISYGKLEGIESVDCSATYIASQLAVAAAAAAGYGNFVGVADTVRDADGKIIGCVGLSR